MPLLLVVTSACCIRGTALPFVSGVVGGGFSPYSLVVVGTIVVMVGWDSVVVVVLVFSVVVAEGGGNAWLGAAGGSCSGRGRRLRQGNARINAKTMNSVAIIAAVAFCSH